MRRVHLTLTEDEAALLLTAAQLWARGPHARRLGNAPGLARAVAKLERVAREAQADNDRRHMVSVHAQAYRGHVHLYPSGRASATVLHRDGGTEGQFALTDGQVAGLLRWLQAHLEASDPPQLRRATTLSLGERGLLDDYGLTPRGYALAQALADVVA